MLVLQDVLYNRFLAEIMVQLQAVSGGLIVVNRARNSWPPHGRLPVQGKPAN
jgi:hypothetical protein